MYTDTDEDAQIIDEYNIFMNQIDWSSIQSLYVNEVVKVIEKPCLPLPEFTNEEEIAELVTKNSKLQANKLLRELIESGLSKEIAESYISYDLLNSDFRKILCSSSEGIFATIRANTREEYEKLSELESLKRNLDFDEAIVPLDKPLEAFINFGGFKFGFTLFCDLNDFKERFRKFVRENNCVRKRWCPEYYSETFETMGLTITNRRKVVNKIVRTVQYIHGIDFKN